MTDTGPTTHPPSPSDKVKAFVADLARPYAIYMVSTATGVAIVRGAWIVTGPEAAVYIGAVGIVILGLYGAKVYENSKVAKHDADVKVAEVQAKAVVDAASGSV